MSEEVLSRAMAAFAVEAESLAATASVIDGSQLLAAAEAPCYTSGKTISGGDRHGNL